MVSLNQPPILHGCQDISQKDIGVMTWTFWGHVTSSVGLAIYVFLLVVNFNHLPCIGVKMWRLKDFGVTALTFWGHMTSSVTWPLNSQCALSYWWWIWTVDLLWFLRYWVSKILESLPWPVGSHDVIGHVTLQSWLWFPIDSQFKPTIYLTRLLRYGASKILGSWSWSFGVIRHHRSRDHWTCKSRFSTGGLFETKPIYRMVAEICCVRHLAKLIPVENAFIPIFVLCGQNRGL